MPTLLYVMTTHTYVQYLLLADNLDSSWKITKRLFPDPRFLLFVLKILPVTNMI